MPSPWRRSHSPAPVPGPELVAVHPEFFLPPVIPVDPAAFGVSLALARISVVHPGAFLPDPLVVAVDVFLLDSRAAALFPAVELVAGDPE